MGSPMKGKQILQYSYKYINIYGVLCSWYARNTKEVSVIAFNMKVSTYKSWKASMSLKK